MRGVVLALLVAPVALSAAVAGSTGASAAQTLGLSRPLAAVSCASAKFCAAVGQTAAWETADGASGALAETWNGKKWELVATA